MTARLRDIVCALALAVSGWCWARNVDTPPGFHGRDVVESLEPGLQVLRKALPDDGRVGLLLGADPFSPEGDVESYFVTQYALAPLLVHPVVAGACVTNGARACGAEALDFFVIQGPEQPEIAAVEAQLGLEPVAAADALRLRRRRP